VVVTLEEEGAGFGFVAIESAAGGAGDFDVVVIDLAVAEDGDATADEGDVEAGPLAEVEVVGRGRVVAVDRAHFVVREFAAFGAHLDFVAAAEIDAGVAVVGAVDFDVELEVLEFLGGLDIGSRRAAFAVDEGVVVDQLAVAEDPLVVGNIADGFPTGEVFAVEKGLRLGPLFRHGAVAGGGGDAGDGGAVAARALLDAFDFSFGRGSEFPGDGGGELDDEFAAVEFCTVDLGPT